MRYYFSARPSLRRAAAVGKIAAFALAAVAAGTVASIYGLRSPTTLLTAVGCIILLGLACSLLLRIRKVRLIVYDDDVALSRIARQYRICLSEVQRAEWRNRSVILSDGCSRMVVRLDWFTVEDQRRFVDYVHTRLRRDLTERLESGCVL